MASLVSFFFSELMNKTDLLSLSGKTLYVTSGSAPALINPPDALVCQYINLQLVNMKPQGTVCSKLIITFQLLVDLL